MFRNVAKFSVTAVFVALLGWVGLYAVRYFQSQNNPEYKEKEEARKEAERIKKEYESDPYGGNTPEETLSLFIDALQKGDTELAAKYFIIDKQDQWRADLALMKEKNLLGEMVRDLQSAKRGKDISSTYTLFSLGNENNESIGMVSIVKAQNHKWKIQDL